MKLKKIIFAFLLALFFAGNAAAKPMVAFGYMQNIKNSRELAYLEYILPNSFANSVAAVFDVNVRKPLELEKELSAEKKVLKKDYEYFELPEFIEEIKSDIFIFGNFQPMPGNQIKILLNLYIQGYSEIFTFTNIGRMETQIAKLVDRISIVIINFMSEQNLYKVRRIEPGTMLSVLTDLDGHELNMLLMAFMRKGYRVSCFQNNDVRGIMDNDSIGKFVYINTGKNSYDVISDWRNSEFYHGTWTGERYEDSVKDIKDLYDRYDRNYDVVKSDTLERLSGAYGNMVDVLLIIGFTDNRKFSWVRAIDMKEKELIWMQSNIKGDRSAPDPVTDNANKIIELMNIEPRNPFIKAGQPAK